MARSSLVLLALMGCGRILGFDDYELDDLHDAGIDAGNDDAGSDADVDADFDGGEEEDASFDANLEPSMRVRQVALGRGHTCALTDTHVLCWGSNALGQLGTGAIGGTEPTPTMVTVARSDFGSAAQLVAGGDNTCIVDIDQSVTCWGDGNEGELTDLIDEPVGTPLPLEVEGTQLAIGGDSMCLATMTADPCTSEVLCWGGNGNGRLGRGMTEAGPFAPGCLAPQGGALRGLVGREHYCGLNGGTGWCWGRNLQREIQNNPSNLYSRPVEIIGSSGGPTNLLQIAVGQGFTCALNDDDEVRCWGGNDQGQLGDATTTDRGEYPSGAIATDVDQLALGLSHGCALARDGVVRCWGLYLNGRLGLGDGVASNVTSPAPIDGVPTMRALAIGDVHGCAISIDDELYCWGDNGDGQIGDGTTEVATSPVRIAIPITF